MILWDWFSYDFIIFGPLYFPASIRWLSNLIIWELWTELYIWSFISVLITFGVFAKEFLEFPNINSSLWGCLPLSLWYVSKLLDPEIRCLMSDVYLKENTVRAKFIFYTTYLLKKQPTYSREGKVNNIQLRDWPLKIEKNQISFWIAFINLTAYKFYSLPNNLAGRDKRSGLLHHWMVPKIAHPSHHSSLLLLGNSRIDLESISFSSIEEPLGYRF